MRQQLKKKKGEGKINNQKKTTKKKVFQDQGLGREGEEKINLIHKIFNKGGGSHGKNQNAKAVWWERMGKEKTELRTTGNGTSTWKG